MTETRCLVVIGIRTSATPLSHTCGSLQDICLLITQFHREIGSTSASCEIASSNFQFIFPSRRTRHVEALKFAKHPTS